MQPTVYFLVLTSSIKTRVVCDIVEKCYTGSRRTIIFTNKSDSAKNLDQLLWTWKQQSFIPHVFTEELSEPLDEPVAICNKIGTQTGFDTLILFDPLPAESVSGFQTVIDFAEKYDEPALQKSRERFKECRDKSYTVESFQPGEFLQKELSQPA